MSTSIFAEDDSADDLFSQQPKKSSKKGSAKKDKDAIENVFDNDNDDFLDTISKSATSPDTAGDKNGPAGPPDDAPVDMTLLTYEERSELRKLKRKLGKDPTMGDLRKIRQDMAKKPAPVTTTSTSKDETDTVSTRSMKKPSTSSITVSVSSKSSKEPEPLKNKIAAFESKTARSAAAGSSKPSPKVTTSRVAKAKPATTSETPPADTGEQQQKLQQLQDRVKALENENDKLKEKNSELSDKLNASQDASEKKIKDLRQQISQIQEETDEYKQKMLELEDENKQLEAAASDKAIAVQEASEKEIEDLKKQISMMEEEQGDLEQALNELEGKNKQLKATLAKKSVDHESQYEAQVKEQEFEERIEDLQKVIESLREESNHLKEESAHFKEESERLHQDTQRKDEEYEKKMEELQKVINELKKESTHLKEESSQLHHESSQLHHERDQEHLQEEHQAALDELNGQISELSIENAELKEEIAILKETQQSSDGGEATTSDLHKEVAELYNKVHLLEQEAEDRDRVVSNYEEQVSSLQKDNKAYQDKISLLERENRTLKADVASLNKESAGQAASGDIEALRKQLKEIEEDRKIKEEDCVAMAEELDDKDREIDELKQQLANAGSKPKLSRSPAPVEQPVAEPAPYEKSGPTLTTRSKSSTPQPQTLQPQSSETIVEEEAMEPPQSIAEEEFIRRQASEHEEEDGFVKTRKLTSFWEQKAGSKAKSTSDIKPPSTKLKSPMPEAENTSWTQSSATATKPAVEIKEDKVADSNIQDDKKDQISEEAVEAEDALGETTGIVHKRLQKMVSTGTVSNNNKPMEKKPLSTQTSWTPPKGDSCAVCDQKVYVVEKLEADKIVYHKRCFKCNKCKKILSVGTYAALEGVIYCKPHFKQLFQEKGNYDEGFGREQHKTKWIKQ